MQPKAPLSHFLAFLIIGVVLGVVFRLTNIVDQVIVRYPIPSIAITFCLGATTAWFYLSYRQTSEHFKLTSMSTGLIKKWDSPAQNLSEIFGKRTRGRIVSEWPSRPVKKMSAKALYQQIWKYRSEHPKATYEQIAEMLSVDRKTVDRALRAGRTRRL